MKKILTTLSVSVLLSACAVPVQQTSMKSVNEYAPYPSANEGSIRSIIYLPAIKNEANTKVEVLIGKNTEVDCNAQFLTGSVKEETLKGWGYSYYVVEKSPSQASTLMACLDDSRKTEFVKMNHNIGLLDYNSKLPIVVYTPSDLQVKYRIWTLNNNAVSAVIE